MANPFVASVAFEEKHPTALAITKRAASFLIEGHGIKDVFLIAHLGCGYYRHKIPYPRGREVLEAQLNDLKVAETTLKNLHSALNVRLFFAQPAGGKVQFREVSGGQQ